ncbi:MAG: hypothetical protein EOO66_04685 [Methylobacterium sp.]|nr:MAG: hypothetical protein EOO66_04685 [Methylobacterium sp.]
MLITGAAGTGKTVVLEDVARVLRSAGRTVLVRQANIDPAPPGRGEMLFVDEADKLPQDKIRQLVESSVGAVVLAGLGTLAQRAGGKPLHVTLAPLGQEAARDYVVQWLASTGRVPAHLDSAALRQVVEASGGVPRLLSTLLGAGAWLAESSGAATITAAHIQEAAELRSVISPMATSDDTGSPERRRRAWWPLVVAGVVIAGSAAVVAARSYPIETGEIIDRLDEWGAQARNWLGGASGKPVTKAKALPAISPHVVPRPEAAIVARPSVVPVLAIPGPVVHAAPAVTESAAPAVTVTVPEADARLPIETQAFLLRRGREMAAVMDMSAARLLYRRAAEGGSAEAAYALGRTYDPAVLTGLSLSQADKQEALRWYRRAAAAGDAAAKAALVGQ